MRHGLARLVSLAEDASSGDEVAAGAVRVDVWGELQGREVHQVACGIGQMREATGLCLSIGAQMMAKNELLSEEGGVYAPEACIEPTRFLAYLRDKGIEAFEDLEMQKPI